MSGRKPMVVKTTYKESDTMINPPSGYKKRNKNAPNQKIVQEYYKNKK